MLHKVLYSSCVNILNMRGFLTFLVPFLAISKADDDVSSRMHSGKCSVWDSNCLKHQLQRIVPIIAAGLPDIGTQRLDPLRIPSLNNDQGGKIAYLENVEMRGLSNGIIDKASFDVTSKLLRIRIIIPTFTVNATHEATGFIHTVPINGKGDMYIRATDLEIDSFLSYDVREDNKGRKFLEFNDYYYSFDTITGYLVSFDDINSNDNKLRDDAHAYLEKNWKPISAEYGRRYLDPFLDALFKAIKTTAHVDSVQNYISDY